jgi:hypothetical protein
MDMNLDDQKFVTQAAYGLMRGVSKQAVSKWKKAGQLVFATDPVTGATLVDVVASDARRSGEQNPSQRQAAAPSAEPAAPDSVQSLFSKSRAAREKASAGLQQIRYAEAAGKLMPLDEVEAVFDSAVAELKRAMTSHGRGLARRIHAAPTSKEAEKMMRQHEYDLLHQFAEAMTRRAQEADGIEAA